MEIATAITAKKAMNPPANRGEAKMIIHGYRKPTFSTLPPLNPTFVPARTFPQPSANFYLSREWRALRYEALKLHGARCQCCGASPATGAVMHVDHIKPRSKFPRLELVLSNLQVLCADCNMGKSNTDSTDWRQTEHITPEESEVVAEAFHRWMQD